MTIKKILPIILSGGSGSRLWPLSRADFPKQFLKIDSNDSLTFIQKTVLRFKDNLYFDDPILSCNKEHRFIAAEQMMEININPKCILLEPISRNTAPAIAISAHKACENGDDPNLLILPSDHVIKENKKFLEIVVNAIEYSNKGYLITFGVEPKKPETGYGYIESEQALEYNHFKFEKIIKFIEKPNKDLANKLLLDKKFSWNSGIFLFRARTFLNELKRYSPEIYEYSKNAFEKSKKDLDFLRVDEKIYSECPNISIDKGIMEKTKLAGVVPLDVGWSDIGNWKSLWEISEKDKNLNRISGNVFVNNANNCYLRSEERLLVGLGIENLLVIETRDAVLVANKEDSENVKKIVEQLISNKKDEAKTHEKVFRPWGSYTTVVSGENWKVKRIIVKPGESLSLQKHIHRSEHWIVVSGKANVSINNKTRILKANESTFIPKESKHRLSNNEKIPLILIEIQNGDYLGEDDIIRYEDRYGRTFNLKN